MIVVAAVDPIDGISIPHQESSQLPPAVGLADWNAKFGSNFGTLIDVAAPGTVSTTRARDCPIADALCTFDVPYVQNVSGTSYSAPLVAGVAVLVLSKYPGKTAEQVKACIINGAKTYATVRNRSTGADLTFNVVDAVRAVECGPPVLANNRPADIAVVVGQQAEFTIAAEGTNLSFEWLKGATRESAVPAPGVTSLGTNSSTFITSATKLADNGSTFFVIVRNKTAPAGVMSRLATLTVRSLDPPVPTITAVLPATMTASSVAQSLTIDGSNFTSGNVVQFRRGAGAWVDSDNAITSLNASQISVPLIPGTTAGTIGVRVCRSSAQTADGDCSSGAASVTVTLPPPPPPPPPPISPDLVIQNLNFSPSTVCTVRPYLRQCTPPEFSATLPPIVQAICDEGSGA